MSGTIRVIDLPDLGAVTDASSIVADKTASTGRFSALALKNYCYVASLPEAPSNNTPYGRMNGAWTPVPPDAPSNGQSYGRLNASWSAVLPEAPLTGSVYGRQNAAYTPVLPMTGGSITGNLGVSGTITGGAVYSNQYSLSSATGFEWTFWITGGSGEHIQQHRVGWIDLWDPASGSRQWNAPGTTLMNLDAAGNLSVLGTVSTAHNIITSASMIATQFWSGTPDQFGFSAGTPGTRIFQFSPGCSLEFVISNATLNWKVSDLPLWVMRTTDNLCFNQRSSVGGNGAYLNISDRRAKTNVSPSDKGLAEVLQLQPVTFDRDNPATPPGAPMEIGFIAQDVQAVVPEAVWGAGIPLQDGTGGLDTAEPTLALSSETITALNVNAIKELNALIAALTDRIAVLEGAAA